VPTYPSRSLRASVALAFVTALLAPVAAPVRAVPVEVGYRDVSYSASGVSAPTGEKPQSKLWHNDGQWWGALFSTASDAFNIYRLNWTTQTWSDTGVVIDARNSVRLDALWDGTRLYVAVHGKEGSSEPAVVHRFSYNATTDTYTRDAGFPVTIVSNGLEAGVIDKDTTGTLWFTYTRSNAVYVTHTSGDDLTWITPYVIPVSGASNLTSDDISSVVAYDGNIGVMWSNSNDWAMHFAYHVDGAPDSEWTRNTAVQEPEYADDHLNLKSLQTDGEGRLYAVTKTSLNASSAPLMLVLILDGNGNWQRRTFGTVADNHTRPLLLIDRENRQLYVFAASPCCSGGVIYYKQTDLDNVNFAPGLGTPFIQSSTDTTINNISSTKQPLDGSTDLVAIAGDDHTKVYLHNAFDLTGGTPDTTPPETTITSGPSGDVPSASATFQFTSSEAGSTFACSLDGAAPTSCTSPVTYNSLALGPHTFSVRATDAAGNPDPTPAQASWTVIESSGGTFLPVADTHVRQAAATTNYGSAVSLSSDAGAGVEERALLKFTVSGASGTVVDARLRVWVTNSTGNGPQLVPSDPSWTESSVTWNTAPALTGAAVANAGSMPSSAWYEIDVTGAISGDGTYSFTFVPESTDGVQFNSREAATNRPELVVTWGGTPDTTPPETTITSGPSGDVGSTTATFEFTASEPGSSFACSLDGAAYSGCTSPTSYSSLALGPHTFDVAATDAAGNPDPTPAHADWTVVASSGGTFLPVADTHLRQAAPTTSYGSVVELSTDAGAGVEERALLKFAVSGISGAVTDAKLRVWVTNSTGNGPQIVPSDPSWAEGTVNWNTAPALTGPAVANAGSMPIGAWFEFDVTSAVSGDGTYSFTFVPESTDAVRFSSREAATNRPELVVTWGGTPPPPDTTPPETTITSGPSGDVESTDASFDFTSSEAGSSFACSLDGAAYGACTSPASYSSLGVGPHTFDVVATDAAGNPDPSPAHAAWTIVPPTSATFTPNADTYVQQAKASNNYGTATTLVVSGRSGRAQEAYLRFNVVGITQPITSVTLRIFVTSGASNGPALLPTDPAWNEGTVTWNARPAVTGAAFADLASVPTGWVDIDVTSYVTGDGTYSILMRSVVSDALRFASRETSTSPQLIVSWAP
jgi:hypothetical protein